ncbi:MAG: DUF4259 domain-containing protein [Verrucomicrobia subdivision 3 bacterium]|nr:DUF4259 domain-containing protein [Limisphaerales bacterium]
MGAWGTAIFSDDTAADIRDDFKDHISDGLSCAEATERILEEWRDSIGDPDDGPVIWLALAATQWRLGRLMPHVKQKAVEIIDSESNLERWEGKDREKRRKVLERLRAQLQSEQPKPRVIPKRFRDSCDWEIGELIAYTTLSNDKVLFRVIGFHVDNGGKSPICELLDWKGREIPNEKDLRSVGIKKREHAGGALLISQFIIGRVIERELPANRVQRVGIRLRPAQQLRRPVLYLWRYLDRVLKDDFDVE